MVTPWRPTAILEISYAPPGGSPVWEDESAYLVRFNIDRGRNNQLNRPEAGTATLVLINRDGQYDPVNASGAHYPDVLPMRRVRLRTSLPTTVPPFTLRSSTLRGTAGATLRAGTIEIYLYTGFVESWSQTWALGNGDAAVTVRCVDAFKVFNLFEFIWARYYEGSSTMVCGDPGGNLTPATGLPHPPDDLTGTRITRVLDCIGDAWPAGDRDLDTGTVTLWGSDYSVAGDSNITVAENALSHMISVAETEGGYLFIDAQGRVRFIDASNIPALDTADVFGGATGEIHFFDITAPYDDTQLWNTITVTTNRTDLTGTADAEDATSITSYYPRELSITLLPTDNATLQARADAYLARYKDPHLRIETLQLAPWGEDEWRHVLERELVDVVLVRKRPAVADEISRELRIEGINIEAPGGTDWKVTWRLSDVGAGEVGGGEGFDSGTFDTSTFGA